MTTDQHAGETSARATAGEPLRQPLGLGARDLVVRYDRRTVIDGLDLDIPDASFTVVVGANASGKSTLLRSLAGLLAPASGRVLLGGEDISHHGRKQRARSLAMLPQGPIAPDGITVADLVSRGRHPHRSLLGTWTRQDEDAVRRALERTNLTDLSRRRVDELSGGQRQRVWIAMALAQDTPILLLDEPTTFLDLAHQIEVLELCRSLHREGRTLVAVLHDLNQAARYGTHLVAMRGGRLVAAGPPAEVVTAELVGDVFGVDVVVVPDPEAGTPLVVPRVAASDRTLLPTPHERPESERTR
ncbi:ABC transporter ATP-binding protein [Aeromicrobium fastidiosum]|uniref:ABC transporter ATP-binding protein n=1 Tax=Aeromicrobium fastidiosum TaxID=52699 RepID=A0A641AP54_9ACTN|nr:ABC transporter ATP-binding protein [Aeromicrobium fastidiosum]KAA1379874.1 ABC transporter ATP-binding protein [Aeromicrobium fastidiosum]MBP2389378.1 iron complex transport system ATP-binding protein [Aeromicrobium fastidiosum]